MNKNIACDAHDYFEIVCMRHNQVTVTTFDGEILHGIALNITTEKKQEVLELQINQAIKYIKLTEVKKLQVENAKNPQHNFVIEW